MSYLTQFKDHLKAINAPRVLDQEDFYHLISLSGGTNSFSSLKSIRSEEEYLNEVQEDLEMDGSLRAVQPGIWLNQLANPVPQIAEAASFLMGGAIVSLHSVLGDSGVFNNYTYDISCVVPMAVEAGSTLDLGDIKRAGVTFRFYGVPILENYKDSLVSDVFYQRAIPEAALVHWAYLVKSPLSSLTYTPCDIDTSELDRKKLDSIAQDYGVLAEVESWCQASEVYQQAFDENGYTF